MWNFVSFREAVIYVVILMLKPIFFFFLSLCFTSMADKQVCLSLLATISAIWDQTQAVIMCPQSCIRIQKSVLKDIFEGGKSQGN